jgi:ATP/ADP translocase/HEAT repeat protein
MNLPIVRRLVGAARRLGLEPHEVGTLAYMGALIAVLMCGYTLAKVVRDALFLSEYGGYALPFAYLGVAFASAGFMWLESRIERRWTRGGAAHLNQYLAIAIGVMMTFAYHYDRHLTAAAFYLWTGSQAMLLLSYFWVLALDVWDSRRARLIFPWLTGCGLIGGLLGGGIAAWGTPLVKRMGLIAIVAVLFFVAHLLTRVIERRRRGPRPAVLASAGSRWQIVRSSRYIQIVIVGLALSVIISTLVDWQFKVLIQRLYPDPHALAEFLGTFYVGLNALALLFQFFVAGWLLQRIGLGASNGLQAASVLAFATWMFVGAAGWVVIAMRWVQGVVFQTLGKSTAEIYFAAIRPTERRRIKPAIDTLVERWSDAAVGIGLIVALHAFRVSITSIALVTATLAGIWLVVLIVLDRQYGRVFEQALANRWIEPEEAAESMRIPSARRAVLAALRSDNERKVVLALRLIANARDRQTRRAIRARLRHASPAVRLAAVQALETMRAGDPRGVVESLLHDPNEAVRNAAVSYRVCCGRDTTAFARRLLESGDLSLRRQVVDSWLDHARDGAELFTPEWLGRQMASPDANERLLAARALGVLDGADVQRALRTLLGDPDVEVRRGALVSAARRPRPEQLDDLLPLLLAPEVSYEAGAAIAAIGEPAIAPLREWLDGRHGPQGQVLAARVLASIATSRATSALIPLARGGDVRLRHLGFQALVRARLLREQPVLSQSMAHRLFLREVREYRECLEPALGLESHPTPEVRLLGDSYRESADMALQRGLWALACWYEPRPLFGVYEPLRSHDFEAAAPALEYLSHILPRAMFRSVSAVFERRVRAKVVTGRLAEWIREAWASGDAWLRACAVRASRFAPEIEPDLFSSNDDLPEIVRAEIAERLGGGQPLGTMRRVAGARGAC